MECCGEYFGAMPSGSQLSQEHPWSVVPSQGFLNLPANLLVTNYPVTLLIFLSNIFGPGDRI